MFFMNEDKLGGFSKTGNNVLGSYYVGGCWCGQSYFVDPKDGLGRVVSSGGRTVKIWKVQTSPKVSLKHVATSPGVGGGQSPGFFTTISSNGNASPIVWALSHPDGKVRIRLFAFDPEASKPMAKLFKGVAGTWPYVGGNANLVR